MADSAIELGNMAGKYILAEISEQEYLGILKNYIRQALRQ